MTNDTQDTSNDSNNKDDINDGDANKPEESPQEKAVSVQAKVVHNVSSDTPSNSSRLTPEQQPEEEQQQQQVNKNIRNDTKAEQHQYEVIDTSGSLSPCTSIIKSKSSEDSDNNNNNNNNNSAAAAAAEDGLFEEEEEEDHSPLYEQHNWLMEGIKDPHQNDVLYGRGGGTNHHPGNKRYRLLVEERKMQYVTSKRLEKPLVALDIISKWRKEQVPPGRFLKVNESTGLWDDVGDRKAREKTSQALREKAPLLSRKNHPPSSQQHYEDATSTHQIYGSMVDDGYMEQQQQQHYHIKYMHPPPPPGSLYPPPIYHQQHNDFDDDDDIIIIEPFVAGVAGTPYIGDFIEQPPNSIVQPPTHHPHLKQQQQLRPLLKKDNSIRFADGTKDAATAPSKDMVRPNMSRFHSLGTEMPDEDALKGFSWESTILAADDVPSGLAANSFSRDGTNNDSSAFVRVPRGTTSVEDEYYYQQQQQQSTTIAVYDRVAHPTGTTSLQRERSLAMNPLRHATVRESAYRSSFDHSHDHQHEQQQHSMESEESLYHVGTTHNSYRVGPIRGSPPLPLEQQQQHAKKYSAPTSYPSSSMRSRDKRYPSADSDDYYNNATSMNKVPYAVAHYPPFTSDALEPIYYQDEVIDADDDNNYQQQEERFWPSNTTTEYEPASNSYISSSTNSRAASGRSTSSYAASTMEQHQQYVAAASAGYSTASASRSCRTPRSTVGERIHVPSSTSSPKPKPSGIPPPPQSPHHHSPVIIDYRDSTRLENTPSTSAVHRDYNTDNNHERIHTSSPKTRPSSIPPPHHHSPVIIDYRDTTRLENMPSTSLAHRDYNINHERNHVVSSEQQQRRMTPREYDRMHGRFEQQQQHQQHYHRDIYHNERAPEVMIGYNTNNNTNDVDPGSTRKGTPHAVCPSYAVPPISQDHSSTRKGTPHAVGPSYAVPPTAQDHSSTRKGTPQAVGPSYAVPPISQDHSSTIKGTPHEVGPSYAVPPISQPRRIVVVRDHHHHSEGSHHQQQQQRGDVSNKNQNSLCNAPTSFNSNTATTKRSSRASREEGAEIEDASLRTARTVTTANYEANANISRPMMKRDTSHQNENPATKKETKIVRRYEEDMNNLTPYIADINLGDSSKTATAKTRIKPNLNRMTTFDFISEAFFQGDDTFVPDLSFGLKNDDED